MSESKRDVCTIIVNQQRCTDKKTTQHCLSRYSSSDISSKTLSGFFTHENAKNYGARNKVGMRRPHILAETCGCKRKMFRNMTVPNTDVESKARRLKALSQG